MNHILKLTLTAITFLSLNSYGKKTVVAVHCNGEEITAENPAKADELLCNKKNGVPIITKAQGVELRKISNLMADIVKNREITYINSILSLVAKDQKAISEIKNCSKLINKSLSGCKKEKNDTHMACVMQKSIIGSECIDNALVNSIGLELAENEFNLKMICDTFQLIALTFLIPAEGEVAKSPTEITTFANKTYSDCIKLSSEEKIILNNMMTTE